MIVDLFAGGGGASVGIEAATGVDVDLAIDHSPVALAVHKANHPRTKHLSADIWAVDPKEAVGRRKVDLLWASPDCTHFSVAKGGKPREHGTRSLAWVVVDWARAVRPAVICLENVREFLGWGPLDNDGKPVKARAAFLAAHYGGEVGTPLDQPSRTVTAQDHHSVVEATLAPGFVDHRAEVRAFLTTYFGSPADIGQDLREPLRTVTTRDRFGLVTVEGRDYEIADIGLRMLQPHELLRAQFGRFAEGYDLSAAETKSAKVRLIGNSVCPEAAEAVVAANLPKRLRRAA